MFIEIITETGCYKIKNDPARIAKFHVDYAKKPRHSTLTRRSAKYPTPLPNETMANYCVRFDEANSFKHVPTTATGAAWHEVIDTDAVAESLC